MVDDNPNDITTSKGQFLWRQRIAKERAHFSPNKRENFSVRSALRVLDVPKCFKPGHIDPHDQTTVEGLDPKTERSLRADVASKLRVPNEQLLWPETEQHQVGWHAKASGPGLPYEERGTMFGLAPRLGIGWRGEKTAGDHAKASGAVNNPPSYDVVAARKDDLISKWLGTRRDQPAQEAQEAEPPKPEPRRSRREDVQHRWLQLQQSWEHQKRLRRERRRQKFRDAAQAAVKPPVETVETSAPVTKRAEVDFSLDKSNLFAPAACAGLRQAIAGPEFSRDDAWQGEGLGIVPRPDSQQVRQVAQAAHRNRNFLNRPGNPWFKPKGSSDVVAFGNAYAKSFGYSVFRQVPGSSSPSKGGGEAE